MLMASTEEPDGPGCGGDRGECECEDECDDPALQVGHHGGPPTPAQSAAASEVSGTREETECTPSALAWPPGCIQRVHVLVCA